MSTHERDIFLWRWSRDRKSGRTRFILLLATVCTALGAVFGLLFDQPGRDVLPTLIIPTILLSNVAFPALRFAIERYASPRWIALVDLWPLAIVLLVGFLLLNARDMTLSRPITIATYSAIGALVGVVSAIRLFEHNETKFRDYLQIDPSIPERRPMPSWSEFKLAGMFLLLFCLAIGPIMILAQFKPE